MRIDEEPKPDNCCIPYRRKALYVALTVPLVLLLLSVLVYLGGYSIVLSIAFLFLYLATCYFQAYCCVYQNCPYVGRFCPAIMGIILSSYLAKLVYDKRRMVKSRVLFAVHAVLASLCGICLVVLPLRWIVKLGTVVAVVYALCILAYLLIFGLTICPVCAIRNTCPGGKLQSIVFRR
jgi:hypothetical protein